MRKLASQINRWFVLSVAWPDRPSPPFQGQPRVWCTYPHVAPSCSNDLWQRMLPQFAGMPRRWIQRPARLGLYSSRGSHRLSDRYIHPGYEFPASLGPQSFDVAVGQGPTHRPPPQAEVRPPSWRNWCNICSGPMCGVDTVCGFRTAGRLQPRLRPRLGDVQFFPQSLNYL